MLSNKLTFSLVLFLVLTFVAGPAMAQVLSPNLNTTVIAGKSFIVYEAADDATTTNVHNGIVNITPLAVGTLTPATASFPNFEEFLRFGGTIELLLNVGAPTAAGAAQANTIVSDGTDAAGITADEAKKFSHRLVISEIMWGLDGTNTESQWIEIYNAGNNLFTADALHLRFHPNTRVDNLGKKMTYSADDTSANAANPTGTWVVVDRVSTTNIRGGSWALRGQSGRTSVGDNGEAVVNLASMYRKRSLSANGMMYKYDDNDNPTGDVFKNGMDGGQWIVSTGRVNMAGPYIGTPGAVHRLVGGGAAVAASPASLPVGTVIINEIYNGEDFQWIELHNNGSAAVNVKKWEMEAAYGDKKLDRVFAIPDKDTNIPAGGFLVITNRDPSETILAGGVDLHDSNKFPAGASQLYIVIEKAGDNKWMPDKGFLLVLRNGNDKNNHEKIVDIAGNKFISDTDPAIATSVWPLKGWAIPGDRGSDAEQKARWGDESLERNVGKTYGRKEQKSRANRLHKDDWQDKGFGVVGGLGYHPGVDLAIAPGTPGYANNAQKANPADITGEVVISEIMYDAGAKGNLVQWIELYNSSMTQSALLNGDWELEIRNIDTDVESYVDAKFDFENAVILPNQTLLLVSDRSSASDVPSNRVYNLYQQHRNELGLSARKSILLSSVGFHLELRYKTTVVDEAGNVMLDGPRRSVEWALPETGGDIRYSIVRGFGTREFDGTPDNANDGTMMSSWIMAESVGSYYGDRGDIGSPGHREGSPLPVSLSSFRPVRDKATGEVVIRWVTQSELNNAGFNILRSESKTGEFTVVNVKGIIAGHGTTSEKHTYEWKDTTAKPNVVYYYQIEDVSLEGNRTTLATTHLRGNVNAAGKVTTTWGDLKTQ